MSKMNKWEDALICYGGQCETEEQFQFVLDWLKSIREGK